MSTSPARPRGWVGTGVPGPGRPKGSRNRLTVQAQNAFRLAFERLGGVNGLVAWAEANPGDFYRIYGRVLRAEPMDAGGTALQVIVARVAPAAGERLVEFDPRVVNAECLPIEGAKR